MNDKSGYERPEGTSLPSAAPIEQLTLGEMIQKRIKIEEDNLRKEAEK